MIFLRGILPRKFKGVEKFRDLKKKIISKNIRVKYRSIPPSAR